MESIPHASGIYQILCVSTGKIYIGSARDIGVRWQKHRGDLEHGKHQNRHLQKAWQKYGADAFQFTVIELVFEVCLLEREQYWLDRLQPFRNRGFNICTRAGSSLGVKRSDEYKAKLSELARARMADPERRAAVSRVHKGKTISDKHKETARAWRVERNKLPESRAVTAAAHALDYIVTAPDGVEYHVHNLTQFCIPRGLNRSAMCRVAKGKAAHHKGWKCRSV